MEAINEQLELLAINQDSEESLALAQEIQLASKYEQIGLDKLSASNLSTFRQSRLRWALRYVLGFKSLYPAPAMYRGNAIERGIQSALAKSSKDPIREAFKFYQFDVAKAILKVYPILPKGWDRDKILSVFAGMEKEKFIQTMKDILENFPKINPDLPEWVDSAFPEKIIKKTISQMRIIEQTFDVALNHFSMQENLVYQRRIEKSSIYETPLRFLGYADFVNDILRKGSDLKTKAKMPKSLSFDEKCQMAAYSDLTGYEWEVVIVAPLGEKAKKEIILLDLIKNVGGNPKAIADAYKVVTGSGTTADFVGKFINRVASGDYVVPSPLKVIKVSQEEVTEYQKWNYKTAQAIQKTIAACDSGNLKDELLFHCISDPDGMFLDPHEKAEIKRVWGITVESEEEDELETTE